MLGTSEALDCSVPVFGNSFALLSQLVLEQVNLWLVAGLTATELSDFLTVLSAGITDVVPSSKVTTT